MFTKIRRLLSGQHLSHPKATLVLGDIVEQDVDAIVNAADETLRGGTGVDGAIHKKAGLLLMRAEPKSQAHSKSV